MGNPLPLNLATLPSLTPPITWDTIPIRIDPVAYNQIGALSKYMETAIPDQFPWLFSTLAASDSLFHADMLSTDGARNLNVRIAAGSTSGGTPIAGSFAFNGIVEVGPYVSLGSLPAGANSIFTVQAHFTAFVAATTEVQGALFLANNAAPSGTFIYLANVKLSDDTNPTAGVFSADTSYSLSGGVPAVSNGYQYLFGYTSGPEVNMTGVLLYA